MPNPKYVHYLLPSTLKSKVADAIQIDIRYNHDSYYVIKKNSPPLVKMSLEINLWGEIIIP